MSRQFFNPVASVAMDRNSFISLVVIASCVGIACVGYVAYRAIRTCLNFDAEQDMAVAGRQGLVVEESEGMSSQERELEDIVEGDFENQEEERNGGYEGDEDDEQMREDEGLRFA